MRLTNVEITVHVYISINIINHHLVLGRCILIYWFIDLFDCLKTTCISIQDFSEVNQRSVLSAQQCRVPSSCFFISKMSTPFFSGNFMSRLLTISWRPTGLRLWKLSFSSFVSNIHMFHQSSIAKVSAKGMTDKMCQICLLCSMLPRKENPHPQPRKVFKQCNKTVQQS